MPEPTPKDLRRQAREALDARRKIAEGDRVEIRRKSQRWRGVVTFLRTDEDDWGRKADLRLGVYVEGIGPRTFERTQSHNSPIGDEWSPKNRRTWQYGRVRILKEERADAREETDVERPAP